MNSLPTHPATIPENSSHESGRNMHGGLYEKDIIPLGGDRVLVVNTQKVSSGALVTTASVSKIEGGFMTHAVFSDFSERLAVSKARCTTKVVAAQHASAMVGIKALIERVIAFYEAKKAKETQS